MSKSERPVVTRVDIQDIARQAGRQLRAKGGRRREWLDLQARVAGHASWPDALESMRHTISIVPELAAGSLPNLSLEDEVDTMLARPSSRAAFLTVTGPEAAQVPMAIVGWPGHALLIEGGTSRAAVLEQNHQEGAWPIVRTDRVGDRTTVQVAWTASLVSEGEGIVLKQESDGATLMTFQPGTLQHEAVRGAMRKLEATMAECLAAPPIEPDGQKQQDGSQPGVVSHVAEAIRTAHDRAIYAVACDAEANDHYGEPPRGPIGRAGVYVRELAKAAAQNVRRKP